VLDCGIAVCRWTVRMVRGTGVPSNSGVVVMGTDGVKMLHPQDIGKMELAPLLEDMSSSSTDSLRIVCSDGDLL
jgi:hypothetical protein